MLSAAFSSAILPDTLDYDVGSVNTYVWRNEQGIRTFVKYHWYPLAGIQVIDSHEAAQLAGENPDYAGKDLFDTLAAGKTVEYGLYVQLMDPSDGDNLPYDPLDDTKVWDERQFPMMPVGRLVLKKVNFTNLAALSGGHLCFQYSN